MGLREAIASAVLLAATQIICSNCLPPGFSAVSIKSHYRLKTPLTNRRVKNLKGIAVANDSKVIRVPGVEYPSAGQIGDYSRFQNYFENMLKPKVTDELTKTSPELRNLKREANHKRKYSMIANSRPNIPRKSAGLEYNPALQPYCFRRSSFFPDVEYPLSARDMWIPNSWNRVLDAERDRPVNIYELSRNPPIKNKDAYSKYVTSPLKRTIEKIYENIQMGKEKTSNINSAVSIYRKGQKNKSSNSVILPSLAPTKATGTLDNAVSIKRKANERHAKRLSDILRISTASSTAEVSSETVPTTRVYTNENPSSLSHNTTQCLQQHGPFGSVALAISPDPDDSLINYSTSSRTNPGQLLSCERELSLSSNNCLSTTISPLLSTGSLKESLVAYESGNRKASVESAISKNKNLGQIEISDNFTFDSNDSIITWKSCPDYSDNFIFVDPQMKSLSQGDYCNKKNTYHNLLSNDSYSPISNSVPSKPDGIVSVVDSNSKICDDLALEKTKAKQLSQLTLKINEADDDSIATLDDANITFQSKYSADTWASCTEVPYDPSDSYTDHVNDIWSAFVNDSGVLCQPISDYSDDACLLFIGANTSTGQGHDTYLEVS